jgi:hypothetical protein
VNTALPIPATARQKISLAENQPQSPLPREYERRFESDGELKAFLDEKELLARIPICRKTAFNWIRAGKLPVVKIGRRKLFFWPNVQAALLRLERNGNGE